MSFNTLLIKGNSVRSMVSEFDISVRSSINVPSTIPLKVDMLKAMTSLASLHIDLTS